MTEQDSLVIDHVGESENGTFQQVFKAERHIVAGFFGLVQTVHVQQVVEQVYHMFTHNSDVVHVIVPAFLFTGIHSQLGTTADDVQRGADVMGNGQDNILPHFQQRIVLFYCFFQAFPVFCLNLDIPLYDKIQNKQQDYGECNQTGNDKRRMFVRGFKTFFFTLKGSPCLLVQACNQHA